ncbi:hypothetical protein PHET_05576 [Paragonimus heterotremus]|uniref:Serpin domain-containing protein n=1 Tax=Paragonimus heterotremus TaxID=100268 RepID=A0A8J4TEX7_9TREM|nr:hypothetical protein PHET_05576 [Paragonimus heterotremus]
MYVLRNYLESDLIRVCFHKLCSALLTQLPNNVHYESSRKEVNKWVEEQTHEMIRELLPTGSINQDTRMIAVNALYFKGDISMKLFTNYRCRWEMVVVLPDKREGLPQLLEHCRRPGVLRSIISRSYRSEEISLFLPRFTLGLAEPVNAKVILNTMGIRDLFNPQTANLSGITGQEPLVVSSVFHQAVLKVDEKGATAAAATAVVISLRSMSFAPNFRVDHPFLVMLVYNRTVPAFVGHCVEPEPN